jgi:hypothetical protein
MLETKMNPEVKAKWLEALRSGEYEQGTGYLCKDGKYCCLGVLTDLYTKENGENWTDYLDADVHHRYVKVKMFDGEYEIPPASVCEWAGFPKFVDSETFEPNPEVVYVNEDGDNCTMSLAELNDTCELNFAEIAELIEAQL